MKTIDFNKTIYELSTLFPDFIAIMSDLGFTEIANPIVLNTMGKIMTIPKGAINKKIDLEAIKMEFERHVYKVLT